MPPVEELGTDYTSFPLAYGADSTGYLIRVIGVADDTDVWIAGLSLYDTIHAGDVLEVEYPSSRGGTRIHCSIPCLAAQYAIRNNNPGDVQLGLSSFMVVLTPDEKYTNDVIFKTPYFLDVTSSSGALSITADFLPGPEELFLDATSLDFLSWATADGGNVWFAYIDLELGLHHLHSSNPENGSVC